MCLNRIFLVLLVALTLCCGAAEYKYVADSALQKQLTQAIEKAAKEFNFAIRGIARRRLTTSTRPYEVLELTLDDKQVFFQRDGKDPLKATIGEAPVKWLDYQVDFARREDGALVQRFIAEDGNRQNVYRFEEDGKILFIDVKVGSPKLKAPIEFTLKYSRVK